MPDLDLERERELLAHATCARGGGLARTRGRSRWPATRRTTRATSSSTCGTSSSRSASTRRRSASPARRRTTCRAINDGVRHIDFDAVEMTISKVTVGGKPAKFDYSDPVLRVELGRALKAGVETEVAITYAAHPRRGLYFVAPDKVYPKKPLQAWTQGQDEDSRHWYPCIDFPNHQQTSEVIVTVPATMISIGNGELKSVRENARNGTRTYHWYQATPHVTYLLSQIVGEFAEIEHTWQGVPVQYYGPKGREADLQRTLDRTPEMLAFFSDVTGVKYPYARYAQSFVADFIFGGMENISATTLTDTSLLDKRASLDADADGLVAHELAHQWFGDLLTCRDWSHGWLNEGFATYFEALFTEHNKGIDEFRYELYQNAQLYMGEDGGRYRRPIVNNVYHEPIDLFDRHLYEKGSLVLHMLRTRAGRRPVLEGDPPLRRQAHAARTSRRRTCSARSRTRPAATSTGSSTSRSTAAATPRSSWRSSGTTDAKQAKLSVTQTQDEKDSSVFRLPVDVDFTVDGKQHAFKVEIAEKAHNFFFALPGKPQMVRFDPGHNFLKTVEFKRGKDMLLYQLKHDDDVVGRIDAAKELAKLGTQEAVDALKDAVQNDKFWGVQVEAARALGGMRSEIARDALLACLQRAAPEGAARRRRRARPVPRRRRRRGRARRHRAQGRRELLRRGRGGAGARQDARARRRSTCCRRSRWRRSRRTTSSARRRSPAWRS